MTENDSRNILTISGLTQSIKAIIEESLSSVWVTGEISNFKHHSSGHMYFSLKDSGAQIPCVMWAGRNRSLYFEPQDGMQIVVQGRVTVYEKRGYYQFDVWQMQPAGVGALQLAFEQLKQRLQNDGLFDQAHKKDLPAFPQRIGIVTSPTGAAIRDFVSVLRRRWPSIEIIVRPVKVQGQGAAEEIVSAIQEFNEYQKVDILVIGRGGGSLEDLWAFNEEIVARAIYASELPIVSAVGHEIDFSISDFVADYRAATPSAAAEMITPDADDVMHTLSGYIHSAYHQLQQHLTVHREKLNGLAKSYGLRRPADLIHQKHQDIDELHHRLDFSFKQLMEKWQQGVDTTYQRLNNLNHENILRRGFAIVLKESDKSLVSKASHLKTKEIIQIKFSNDRARAQVIDNDMTESNKEV